MMKQTDAHVVVSAGAGIANRRIQDASLEEMIFRATSEAIAGAGLTSEGIEAVVISGNDQLDGRIISCMVTAGAVAGVGKNVTTIASAPEHAFAYGCMRLLAGAGENVLVVGWSKPSESVAPEHAELVSTDPFLTRPIGMNRTIAAALQASAQAPTIASDAGLVAWPLTSADVQAHADGVCAMVLEKRARGDERKGARVRGVGWALDRFDMGDRATLGAGGLDEAIVQASGQAGESLRPVEAVIAYAHGLPNERYVTERVVERLGDAHTKTIGTTGPTPDFAAGLFTIWDAAQHIVLREPTAAPHWVAAATSLGFAGQGTTVVLLSDTSGI